MKKTAQTVISADKFYNILAANGKAVEVKNHSEENGAAIQLMELSNAEWQQWSFTRVGDSVYRICNRATGKLLDLMECGVVNGTWLHQWEGAQGSSQLWIVENIRDGRVKIRSNLSGKCMDIVDMSQEDGARLQIWQDVNGENQAWSIVEAKKSRVRRSAAKKAKQETSAEPIAEKAVEKKEAPTTPKKPVKETGG